MGPLEPRLEDPLAFFFNLSRKCGDIARFRVGGRRVFLLNKPDHVRQVLELRPEDFPSPEHHYRQLAPMLNPVGHFLLRLEPETNTSEALQALEGLTLAATDRLVTTLQSSRGETSDLTLLLKGAMLDLAIRALFGLELDSGLEDFVRAVSFFEGSAVMGERQAHRYAFSSEEGKLAQSLDLHLRSQQTLAEEILNRLPKAAEAPREELSPSIIQTLISAYNGSGTALCWTLGALASHREQQEELRSLVAQTLAGVPPGFAALPGMQPLVFFIREALRLHPPAWLLAREAAADARIDDTTIPKGSLVYVCPYTMHRRPAQWEEPECMRPERFELRPSRQRHALAFLPFGAGERKCPAAPIAVQKLALMIARLLQSLRLEARPDSPAAPLPLVSMGPAPGWRLRWQPLD